MNRYALKPFWGHDIFPSRASPLSEGELAAHVPHHQALEAPLDDVLSEQRETSPHPPRSGPQDSVISPPLSMSALPPEPGFHGKNVVTPMCEDEQNAPVFRGMTAQRPTGACSVTRPGSCPRWQPLWSYSPKVSCRDAQDAGCSP